MKKRTLVILGASSILALGIAAPVAAATSHDHNAKRQQLATALAKELGVEESKVTAALEKLRSERPGDKTGRPAREDLKTRLDAAVQAGKLTRAEADAVLKAAEAGILGPGGGHGRGPGRR
jgi:hypothetical protein